MADAHTERRRRGISARFQAVLRHSGRTLPKTRPKTPPTADLGVGLCQKPVQNRAIRPSSADLSRFFGVRSVIFANHPALREESQEARLFGVEAVLPNPLKPCTTCRNAPSGGYHRRTCRHCRSGDLDVYSAESMRRTSAAARCGPLVRAGLGESRCCEGGYSILRCPHTAAGWSGWLQPCFDHRHGL